MQWASERGHVVLTADLDFGAILAATQSTRPKAIGGAVVTALRQTQRELLEGALVSVDAARARLRILPLGR
jgi:predicted nuclease of predicted toxin-antitoxin system